MRPLARALVGVAICSSTLAYAEAQRQAAPAPPPQAAPQPQAPTPKKVTKKAAAKAPAPKLDTGTMATHRAPADSGAQVNAAGDGAPVPAARCKIAPLTGTPLFEARFSSGPKLVVTRLYPSGTFTRAVMKEQKTACIDAPQLTEIRIALKEAPWKTTKSPATCNATTGETTQIYAAGTLRFTSRTCNPLVLDKLSSRALDLIAQDVGAFGLDLATEVVEGN